MCYYLIIMTYDITWYDMIWHVIYHDILKVMTFYIALYLTQINMRHDLILYMSHVALPALCLVYLSCHDVSWPCPPNQSKNSRGVVQSTLPQRNKFVFLLNHFLRQHIWFNGKAFFGYEDIGDSPGTNPARHVMMLMVTSLNMEWKVPVAYFLLGPMHN